MTPVVNGTKTLHPQWTDRLHSFLEFNIIDLLSFTISSSASAVHRSESRTREKIIPDKGVSFAVLADQFFVPMTISRNSIFFLGTLNTLIRCFDLEFRVFRKKLIFAVGSVWKSFCCLNFYMIFRNRAYLPSVDSIVVIYCTWDV